MREEKRKNVLRRLLLILLLLYAAVVLIPFGVYQAAETMEAASSAASSAPKPSPSKAPPAPESSQPDAPGFLQGVPLPKGTETSQPAESEVPEDAFTLYDQSSGKTLTVSGKDLLPAALACEMDLFSPEEALKAQAVACYTLFSRKRSLGETIVCDCENWQVWTTEEHMRQRWGEDFDNYMGILRNAVEPVYGQLLEYDGEPILAAYFAISGGNTEAAANVWGQDLPYLQASASPGDLFSDGYLSKASFTAEEFKEAVLSYFDEDPPELSGDPESWLTGLSYTPSGYVEHGLLGGREVSGADLRGAFSLRSACFQVEWTGERFDFTVKGWGHGVGMSQAGAVFLAKRGAAYGEILSHYYPGTELVGVLG